MNQRKIGRTAMPRPCLLGILFLLLPIAVSGSAQAETPWTGRSIMNEVFRRHERFPYAYEEQTMILRDREGNREVRKARRFSGFGRDGLEKILLVFDTPPEVRGVALLGTDHPAGRWEWALYLPAFGKKLIPYDEKAGEGRFLGTDFAVVDLSAEVLSDFRYVRAVDQRLRLSPCYVVEALPRDKEIERRTGYSLRRHFVRQDNFFIIRTDYYGRRNRLLKRQTFHDLRRVDGEMWHADMILMENSREGHRTMIKVDRRVFSRDYVSPEIFEPSWLLENRHVAASERHLFQADSGSSPSPGPASTGPAGGERKREKP